MSKHLSYSLLSITAAALLVVVSLLLYGRWYSPFSHDFARRMAPEVLFSPSSHALPAPGVQLAGSDGERVFIYSTAGQLKVWGLHLLHGTFQPLDWGPFPADLTSARLTVSNNQALIFDESTTSFCVGEVPLTAPTCFADHALQFQQAFIAANDQVIFQQAVEESASQEHLTIIGSFSTTSQAIQWAPDLLRGDRDRYFTTKGTLRYSDLLKQLVFVYAYRGEVLVFDTTLQTQATWGTIDKSLASKIKPVRLSDQRYALASPDWVVNENARVYQQWLLVQSNVRAANESRNDFARQVPIDVYALSSGRYQMSFYLPLPEGETLKDFLVTGDRLVALYSGQVMVYECKMRNTF